MAPHMKFKLLSLLTLPSLTILAQTPLSDTSTPASAPDLLKEVVVTAEKPGYAAPATTTGAQKTDTPLLKTAQAVSVVTEQLARDQDARKLEDILRNVAGISPGGYYDGWDYYRIRGFNSAFNTFWDGLRGDYGMNAEVYGMERVEVIKGPASTLYGQAPLGGLVNMVSKRPRRDFSGEVGFTAGSFDYYEGTLDITGPLLRDASGDTGINVLGRMAAFYKNAGSFVDFVDTERLYLAPSLTFELGEDTSLTLLVNYTRDSGVFPMPLPASGTVTRNPHGEIPIERFLGLPGVSNEFVQERLRVGYEFRHRFNDHVSLRQNFSYSRLEQDWNDVLYNASLDPDGRTLYLYPYRYTNEKMDRFAVDTALDFRFDTGSLKHTLTAGMDYYRTNVTARNRQIDYADFPGSYVAIDLFNPSYNFTLPAYSTKGSTDTAQYSLGFYLQEQVELTEQVTLTLGGRYDKAWHEVPGLDASNEAFTPKAGLAYEFTPGVSAYANYSRSFQPQWYSTDADGTPVDPEEGENLEAGLKYDLADGRLTGMISVFHLTRENVATANLATANPFDSIVSGEQRSRGFEFETAAELAPGLLFTAAYTYLDAEVTRDNTLPVGARLQGVPEHAASAWLKYTLQEGCLRGLGFGIGGRYYTEQAGDAQNSFNLPAYGLLDTALYYERDNFRMQLNFNNVLDRRHFVGSYNDLYVLPGRPFNLAASVTWKF